MQINDALATITAAIKTLLTKHCSDVESHPGRFTEVELTRVARSKSAVRIAVEDIVEIQVNGLGKRRTTCLMTAFIICSDAQQQGRSEKAIELAEIIISALPRNDWNSESLQIVLESSISAQNLYNGEINKKGVAMWVVSWQQVIKNF
ncbi:hypothetical protein N9J88_03360 [Porticoccaceae bacterium]|nr:hypothetical protein [Porticoccaceae bacterium]